MRLPAPGEMTTSPMATNTIRALEEQRRGATAQLPGADAEPIYTLDAGGAIKPTVGVFAVDTFGAAASDNLDHITGEPDVALGGFPGHGLILLRAANTARTVVVRHEQGGAYDISLTSLSFSLDDDAKRLLLMLDGTRWYEVWRGYASDNVAHRTRLGITSLGVLANPAAPADDGKFISCQAGGFLLADPLPGDAGFLHQNVSSNATAYTLSNGSSFPFGDLVSGDVTWKKLPTDSELLQIQFLAAIPSVDSKGILNTTRLLVTVGAYSTDPAARGLPRKSFMLLPISFPNRLTTARIGCGSGCAIVATGHTIGAKFNVSAGTTSFAGPYGRSRMWISAQWM